MVYKYDFLIIGSGIAGMSYALKVARAHKGKVCMICKTSLDEANASFAQGGVASVTNLEIDNFDKHIQDTMIAGDYISDYEAVKQVVTKALNKSRNLLNGVRTLTRCKTVDLISTVKVDILNSEFFTMQTIPAQNSTCADGCSKQS